MIVAIVAQAVRNDDAIRPRAVMPAFSLDELLNVSPDAQGAKLYFPHEVDLNDAMADIQQLCNSIAYVEFQCSTNPRIPPSGFMEALSMCDQLETLQIPNITLPESSIASAIAHLPCLRSLQCGYIGSDWSFSLIANKLSKRPASDVFHLALTHLSTQSEDKIRNLSDVRCVKTLAVMADYPRPMASLQSAFGDFVHLEELDLIGYDIVDLDNLLSQLHVRKLPKLKVIRVRDSILQNSQADIWSRASHDETFVRQR